MREPPIPVRWQQGEQSAQQLPAVPGRSDRARARAPAPSASQIRSRGATGIGDSMRHPTRVPVAITRSSKLRVHVPHKPSQRGAAGRPAGERDEPGRVAITIRGLMNPAD